MIAEQPILFRCDGGDAVNPCLTAATVVLVRLDTLCMPPGWMVVRTGVTPEQHYCPQHHVQRTGAEADAKMVLGPPGWPPGPATRPPDIEALHAEIQRLRAALTQLLPAGGTDA